MGRRAERRAGAVSLLVVLVVHLAGALINGTSPRLAILVPPVVAAALVHALARGFGLTRWCAVAVAVLVLGCPLAVVASQSPGAGLLALVVATTAAVVAGALVRPPGRARAVTIGVLALSVLVVRPLTATSPRAGHGWGTGAHRLDSGAHALAAWPGVDPVLPVLSAVAAVVLLVTPGRRLLGAGVVTVAAAVTLLDLPPASLVAALPLVGLALVVAALRVWHARTHAVLGVAVVALAVVAAVLVPVWALSIRRLPVAGADTPVAATSRWLSHQVSPRDVVAVDRVLYDQLADSPDPVAELVPIPASAAAPPDASRVRWVVSTALLRGAAAGSWGRRALTSSRPVASFGRGEQRLEVRALTAAVPGPDASGPTPTPAAPTPTSSAPSSPAPSSSSPPPSAANTAATTAPSQAALELASNPQVTLSSAARTDLTTLAVDDRLVALLAQLASTTSVSVRDLPVTAPDPPGVPRRTAVIDAVAGAPVSATSDAVASLRITLAASAPAYRPSTDLESDGGVTTLVVTLPPAT